MQKVVIFLLMYCLITGCQNSTNEWLEGPWQGHLYFPLSRDVITLTVHSDNKQALAELNSTTLGKISFPENQVNISGQSLSLYDDQKALYVHAEIQDTPNTLIANIIRGRTSQKIFLKNNDVQIDTWQGEWSGELINPSEKIGFEIVFQENLWGQLSAIFHCPQLKIHHLPVEVNFNQDQLFCEIPYLDLRLYLSTGDKGTLLRGEQQFSQTSNRENLLLKRPRSQSQIAKDLNSHPDLTHRKEAFQMDRIIRLISELSENSSSGIQSLIIYQNGNLIVEEYFRGMAMSDLQDIGGIAKSLTSVLVGAAIEKGWLNGVETPIAALIPEVSHTNPITVRDLLNMTSGLSCNDYSRTALLTQEKLLRSRDWLRPLLDLPSADQPGTTWAHCIGEVFLLGELLIRSSELSFPLLADSLLFKPLDIQKIEWRFSPENQANVATSLMMRPLDLAKIGRLYLTKGIWDGKRILAESWTKQAAMPQIETRGSRIFAKHFSNQWWVMPFPYFDREVMGFFAAGNGGQFLGILPELKLVVVMTGRYYNQKETAEPIQILSQKILKALR